MQENAVELLERIALSLERIAISLEAATPSAPVMQECQTQIIAACKNESTADTNHTLITFLESRNIKVKHCPPENEYDEVLDHISLFMGNRFPLIKNAYELIKRNMNDGNSFKMHLKNATQEEISSICQLFTMLHEIAFLSEYTYVKSPKYMLYAQPNRIPKALNFFSGQWLERFIKAQVNSEIKKYRGLTYSYLMNPQIILPNGDDFELDMLLEIENDIYWFEAKTGEYQRYVQKYSNMAKLLKLTDSHTFMILTDITPNGCAMLKNLFGMTVTNIDNFQEQFSNLCTKYKKVVGI